MAANVKSRYADVLNSAYGDGDVDTILSFVSSSMELSVRTSDLSMINLSKSVGVYVSSVLDGDSNVVTVARLFNFDGDK